MQNFADGIIPVGDNKASSLFNLAKKSLADQYELTELINICYWILEHFTGLNQQEYIQHPETLVNQSSLILFSNAIDQLKQGMPVQYVIGEMDFYKLRLKVTQAALIPRPETEELVDMVVRQNSYLANLQILDIGTGSGCIGISLAKNLKNSTVIAIDKSSEALDLAKQNAQLNMVANIEFFEMDFLEDKYLVEKEFDIMISNPPYIAQSELSTMEQNVLNFEPHIALFVPNEDPLIFYKKLAEFAKIHLKNNGLIYMEINQQFGQETADIFRTSSFSSVELLKDMFGNNRFIKAVKK